MLFNKKSILTISILSILLGCTNSNMVQNSSNTNSVIEQNSLYQQIVSKIQSGNLDSAEELYIKLKESEQNSEIKKAASMLAVAHMAKKEYILANFFIQEALAIDSSDEFLKYLLIKNQFLAANMNNTDKSYINKALNALESNRYLVSDSDYQILANTMLTRVKLDIAWGNKRVSNLYKNMNKPEAYRLYKQKVETLGFDVNDIVKN